MSADHFTCVEYVVPGQHIRNYARATSGSQEAVFQLAVKQYIPRYPTGPEPGDVTILACQANGCPKEMYEPLWDELFQYTVKTNGFRIRSIWIADIATQGASGVLNEGLLGNEPSLLDHARDYLALVNHFRSEMPRPIIGFGHSMGGTVLMNVALMHPRLFTTFIGIEPPVNSSQASLAWASAAVVTFRKDTWASKEEAVKSFRTNPFYKRWDERVFERYFRYAFRPVSSADADGPVTLVTSKDQEAANMARAVFMRAEDGSYIRKTQPDLDVAQTGDRPFYSQEVNTTFSALPQFRPSCLYIYGEHSNMGGATAPQRSIRLKTTGAGVGGSGGAEAGRVQERMLKGSHYLPFESPERVAKCAGSWIQSEMTLWAKKEEEENASWEKVPVEKRSKVDDDWKYWMKETYMKKKPSKI